MHFFGQLSRLRGGGHGERLVDGPQHVAKQADDPIVAAAEGGLQHDNDLLMALLHREQRLHLQEAPHHLHACTETLCLGKMVQLRQSACSASSLFLWKHCLRAKSSWS